VSKAFNYTGKVKYADLATDIKRRMLEWLDYVIGMDPKRVAKKLC
jgi:hypothetical protein